MRLVDSRRLRGPNLQTREPAAIAEVELEGGEATGEAIEAWRDAVARYAAEIGWGDEARGAVARAFPGGVAFALPAPVDVLLEATDVNDLAVRAATEALAGRPTTEVDRGLYAIRASIETHRNPALVALRAEALRRGVPVLWDDDRLTLGMARRSVTFPIDELPRPASVAWGQLGRIPVALVTGTNGKTTTTRLIARMARLAGHVPGTTSTDGIAVDERMVEEGDWTGAEAARNLLRRRDVELAVLETARGGILRRGLALDACDAALVTNVASDHLGEFGVLDLATMARAKAVVGTIVVPEGRVVLGGDDPRLVALASTFRAPVVLFTRTPRGRAAREHVAAGGELFTVRAGSFVRVTSRGETALAGVSEAPLTFGGSARHNVANCLAAAAVAWALGLPDAAIAEGLRTFGAEPADNPGRGQLVHTPGGTRVLLDFGHNPAGMRELVGLARSLLGPGGRIASVHTQPGDRTASDSAALAREIARADPRTVVLWESEDYRRGRAPGDIAATLRSALIDAGVGPARIRTQPTEVAAITLACEGARPADVIVVAPHIEHAAVRALLGQDR